MNTILITGASTGIGQAIATVFADNGWNVVATMRNPSAGAELAARPNVLVTRLDVQDASSIPAAIDAGIARFDSIDMLVNNAGLSPSGIFEEIPLETIQDTFAINVFGVMDVTRAILPHFRERKRGVIVNVSSLSGLVGVPLTSIYNASKFALEGFSESLSYELLSQNIVVKLVEPGLVRTNMSDNWLKQLATPITIPDYETFVRDTVQLFTGMMDDIPDAPTVAQNIFEAATDGTDRLRYVVTEAAAGLAAVRHEKSEEEYMAYMRSIFLPK